MRKNDYDEFELKFFERLLKANPHFVDAMHPLAEAYTRKGLYEKGLEIYRRLSKLCPGDPIVHYNLACSLALVGSKEESLNVLKTSIKMGYRDFHHMQRDPDLKSLREDPRFQKLTKKS